MIMQSKNILIIPLLVALGIMGLVSCEKAASELPYGSSVIYMPQAILKSGGVDNSFPVPSGVDSATFNYIIDRPGKKVHVLLGAALSGPESGAYKVDIQVNNDTIQQLLNTGIYNPGSYMLMPASLYTLPATLDVAEGSRSNAFQLSLDIDQLKQPVYAGKFLLLAVKIANPSRYTINNQLSTTVVVLDVNTLVIGPRKDFVGGDYIKNPGNPFVANGFMAGSTRWGNLLNWNANAAARSHGGFGGYNSDNGGTMDMESGWGSPQILNGKIYQTITLPAGDYYYDLSGGNWTGGECFLKTQDPAYSVVAMGQDTLPDFSNIVNNPAVKYQLLVKAPQPVLTFQLTAPAKVTLGVVVNYVQTEQGFKTKQVMLYSFPNHL